MKLNCGPTTAEKRGAKIARLEEWHRFFALWPRRITWPDRRINQCVWLEFIERRGSHHYGYSGGYWDWEYRELGWVVNPP